MIYFLFLVWIGFRSLDRFLNPQILSEDGRVFVTEAFGKGISSLFDAYAGYFHTLPRMIALFASLFPVEWLPLILTLPCYFLFAYLCFRVTHDDFSELFPSRIERISLGILISLSPGLTEVFGNPTNIHWILTLYLGLLCLRNKEAPLTRMDYVLGTLAVASGGECLALIPCFLGRVLQTKQKKIELYFLGLILLFAILNFLSRESGPGLNLDFIKKIPSGFTYLWTNWMLLQPLIGDHLTEYLGNKNAGLYWVLAGFLSLALAISIFQKRKKLKNHGLLNLFCFVFSFLILLLMVWLARTEAFGIFNQITRDAGYSRIRYGFLMGAPILIFHLKIWPWAFQKLAPRKWALIFTISTVGLSGHRLLLKAHEPSSPSWQEKLNQLPQDNCQDPATLEVWPEGWFVKIPLKKLELYCSSSRESGY